MSRFTEASHRRSKVSAGVVPEFLHQGMSIERRLHDSPLNASAAPGHEPHLIQASASGGVHVLLHDGRNIPRREGMKVELRFDGHYVHEISEFRLQSSDFR